MDNINYYLVLEKRHGDYILIDINKLDIVNNVVTNDIASIDGFTMNYTESEIKESILRSNMATSEYLAGNLRIISDVNHNLSIITKEIFKNVTDFQYNVNEEMDRNFKNKLFGIYKKVIEKTFNDEIFRSTMINNFKDILKSGNKNSIMKVIEDLPYVKARLMYLAISMEQERKKELNLKKLNKDE